MRPAILPREDRRRIAGAVASDYVDDESLERLA
jgi:hypothetical protein